jgi:hypothetical protein
LAWLFTWEKLLNIFCIFCNSVKILIRWARLEKTSPVIKEIERKARYLKHMEKSKEQEALDWLIFLITGEKIVILEVLSRWKKWKEVETIFCWNEQEQNSSDSYACVVDIMRNPHIFLINFNHSDYYPLLAQFKQYITGLTIFKLKSKPTVKYDTFFRDSGFWLGQELQERTNITSEQDII